MSQILCDYVAVLKEVTRLEGTIKLQLDHLNHAMSRLAGWEDDGCWDLNTQQVDWSEVPPCDQVLEMIQAWREAQAQLATLEAMLPEDERSEILN